MTEDRKEIWSQEGGPNSTAIPSGNLRVTKTQERLCTTMFQSDREVLPSSTHLPQSLNGSGLNNLKQITEATDTLCQLTRTKHTANQSGQKENKKVVFLEHHPPFAELNHAMFYWSVWSSPISLQCAHTDFPTHVTRAFQAPHTLPWTPALNSDAYSVAALAALTQPWNFMLSHP